MPTDLLTKTGVLEITGTEPLHIWSPSNLAKVVHAAYFNAQCSMTSCSYNLTIVDIEDVYQAHLHAGNSSVADGELHLPSMLCTCYATTDARGGVGTSSLKPVKSYHGTVL